MGKNQNKKSALKASRQRTVVWDLSSDSLSETEDEPLEMTREQTTKFFPRRASTGDLPCPVRKVKRRKPKGTGTSTGRRRRTVFSARQPKTGWVPPGAVHHKAPVHASSESDPQLEKLKSYGLVYTVATHTSR